MKTKMFLIVTGLCFCVMPSALVAQNAEVPWSTFSMGFGIPASGNTAVKLAVGQSFVGTSAQGNTKIESGFLGDTLLRGPLNAVQESGGSLPATYGLAQNYPNPFNPSTVIRYSLPARSQVMIEIFNILGERIVRLFDGTQEPGVHEVEWSASRTGVASGVYFYRLRAAGLNGAKGDFTETRKMVLMQ